jgi:signal transduction histidine kinase
LGQPALILSHLARRRILGTLLTTGLLVAGLICLRAYLVSPSRGLPSRDSFSQGHADEWEAFGGTWEVVDGMMRNDSDERGAKLMTGSRYWRNYSIEADVMLLGAGGDAGLIVRANDEEQGVDSYAGYYAGLRSGDDNLVLGRADYGWTEELRKLNPAQGTIKTLQWYHLKVLVYDCEIAATATTPSKTFATTSVVTDKDCITSGRAGLRSYASGGVWRNVLIRSATADDLTAMVGRSTGGVTDVGPQLSGENQGSSGFNAPTPRSDLFTFHSSSNTQSISSLRLTSFAKPAMATVRGGVILTAPILVVQDSTGGVSVPQPVAPLLKVGDQVEVSGEVHLNDFSSSLEHATVRVLWEGTPMPAVTVSASQAATGAFDATFVEVEGRLRNKKYGPDNTLIFSFDAGSQSFGAIMNRGRGDYLFGKLKPNSLLRLHGVSMVDPAYTNNLTPFVLLVRSADDVDVLAGPPWWSTGHLIATAFALLALALAANFFYSRAEHWRLRAVLDERQRLAHEMHDTLAQSFAGIGFQLEAIRSGVPGELPATHQQLDLASDLVRHSHEEARRSIATLRPESPESGDLLKALYLCARRMVEGGSVEVLTICAGDVRNMPLRITDTLYRIGQEAIANAVRHAHPATITITLEYGKNLVRLLVEDDGVGFKPSGDLRGFGVRGMRKRAAGISATLEMSSAPERGTRVQISAPLPPPITLRSLPRVFWKYMREYRSNAKSVT